MIFVRDIQRAVASECAVPLRVMSEPDGIGTRVAEHSHPRQLAILLSTRLTNHSLKRIGYFFGGRDHSTVISACRSVQKRGVTDDKLHNAMRRLTLQLVRH